jgi:hypothetical protein
MELAATEAGRAGKLGNIERLHVNAQSHVQMAHITMRDAVAKIEALKNDKSRNDVEKHHHAKKITDNLISRLQTTRDSVAKEGAELIEAAVTKANDHFAPSHRGSLEADTRAWVREQVKAEGGIANIREAMSDHTVASVLWHSFSALLNMSKSLHQSLRVEAMQTHLPAEATKVVEGDRLVEVAAKYDHVIVQASQSMYEPAIAAQWASRVNVDEPVQ